MSSSSSSSSYEDNITSSSIEGCSGSNIAMSTMFDDDLRSIMGDLEQFIVYKKVHYCAIIGDVNKSRNQIDIAGFMPSANLEITIINSDFMAGIPSKGEIINYKTSNYKVSEYLDSADNITSTFTCESMKDGT